MTGVCFAKGLAYATKKPLIAIDHIKGHTAANYLCFSELEPPFTALVVSGGHTSLFAVESYTSYRVIGSTRDDAAGEVFDKVLGLELGADDYVIKPFSANEVMARVRAVLRRIQVQEQQKQNVYDVSNLHIDLDKYTVEIGGEEVPLTKKEIELLWTLAKNSTKVFSRENLLDSIWGYDYFGDSRTVDSHIKRLRAKLDKYEHEGWDIKTIWGVGYRFEVK